MLEKKGTKETILLILDFAIYVFIVALLIFFAASDATKSTSQSGFVTNMIVTVVNTIAHKEVITATSEITHLIRKLIGHFGMFMALGFFSSLFYLPSFKNKKLFTIINFSQGVFLAILTEVIQLFTPGRAFAIKDILIDSSGFLISSIIITIIYISIIKKSNAN